MKVKLFDFEHEQDLEDAVNLFIDSDIELLSIYYQTSHFFAGNEQVFSFSALILYKIVEK